MEYKYVDHLQEYMREKAKRFIEHIEDHYPPEIFKLKKEHPDRLIELLAEGATPVLRGLEDNALDATLARLVISIRWAKQHPNAGKYNKPNEGGKQ